MADVLSGTGHPFRLDFARTLDGVPDRSISLAIGRPPSIRGVSAG
jgi:hypothetical protein